MKKFVVCCFLLFVFHSWAYSQNYEDAGLWTTVNVEKKLKNNFSVFFTEEFRLKENFSRINLFYTDAGVSLRPYSFLKLAFAYRFVQKYQIDDTYSFRHRLIFDVTLRRTVGSTALSYRHRLQSEVRDVQSSEKGGIPEWYSRNKAEVKYDLQKKYTPFASLEFRYQFRSPYNVESDRTWHNYRAALGVEYELNKKNIIGLYYLIQREWNVSRPDNLYIVGIEYSLTL